MEGEYVERTFVALKPDAVKRGLVGEIVARFEDAGFKICGMKMVETEEDLLEEHYQEHIDKPFYDRLLDYMQQGPVVAMVLEGVEAIENIRKIVGDTNPKDAHPATLRGRYGHMSFAHADEGDERLHKNLIHASADKEDAEREIEIWFSEDELHDFEIAQEAEVR